MPKFACFGLALEALLTTEMTFGGPCRGLELTKLEPGCIDVAIGLSRLMHQVRGPVVRSRGGKIFHKPGPGTANTTARIWVGPASSPAFISGPGIKPGIIFL